jgi:hypothetical protein
MSIDSIESIEQEYRGSSQVHTSLYDVHTTQDCRATNSMCLTTKKNPRKRKSLDEIETNEISNRHKKVRTGGRIEPQGRISKAHRPIQCWAHSKTGNRCCKLIKSREGEPIPIPYCDRHLQAGDGALRRASHPFAGSCLIANFDLPKNYRMVLWGYRGKCNSSDKEDRSVSFYPPNPKTGRNLVPFTKTLKTDNYNGVINPTDTGDLLQFASCPGPTERQNMR